jgi:hypothetical protein
MLGASAALAGLLLGAYLLTPAAQLHYHAWRFRAGRDPEGRHLCRVIWSTCIKRKAGRDEVVRLLGPSQYRTSSPDSLYYIFASSPPGSVGGYLKGFEIEFQQGLVVMVKPWQSNWRAPSPEGGS